MNKVPSLKALTMLAQDCRKSQQQLIDIMFEITMRMHSGDIKITDREKLGKYISDQLRQCGYDTQPIGSSWGVLR